MIQCEKRQYEYYCKDHPKAKGLYGVSFPHFNILDAVYGKNHATGEGLEESDESIANMENGNPNEVGDEEVKDDRMSIGPSGRSLDATLNNKMQKNDEEDGKKKTTELSYPLMEMFKDVHGHFQSIIEHVGEMAAAMEQFKDVHDHFKSVIQHVGMMAAAMEQFKDVHDNFQIAVQHGRAMVAEMEYETEMQQRTICEEPQQKAKVTAISEMQKLGFTGTEAVNAASIFAKEPNQMEMFLALPEIYKREYVLKMLSDM